MHSFSVIICTFNPDPLIFNRLLTAIDRLQQVYSLCEIIIVDNNSAIPLKDTEATDNFINIGSNRKVISEPEPGLTNARIAGSKVSVNPWVVFFDDDNEPDENYLSELNILINQYPQVGCWGAGSINVEYIGSVKGGKHWSELIRPYFQQRSLNDIYISGNREWSDTSPYGTGLVIRKDLLNEYIKNAQTGVYTLSDRKSGSLSSGGDIQIIFTAIAEGGKIGTSPNLALNHLIKSEKTSLGYLCRLSYGTSSAYLLAYNEVFKDNPHKINTTSNYTILKLVYYLLRTVRGPHRYNFFLLSLCNKMGQINASYLCVPYLKRPVLLKIFENIFNCRMV